MAERRRNSKLNTLVLTARAGSCFDLFQDTDNATKGYSIWETRRFFSVMLLGKKNEQLGRVGSCLSDLIGGYAYYAPWTLGTKFLMALAGLFWIMPQKSAEKTSAAMYFSL